MAENISKILKLSLLSAIALALFCLAGCGGGEDAPAPESAPADGFTLFDLTAGSRFDAKLRDTLREKLGSDAITRRGTLDLEIAAADFYKEHLPDLHDLNGRLNYSPRERIEHSVTKLMYRYPSRKNVPFDFVELVFSNDSGKPLTFLIAAGKEGASVIGALEDRYGEARRLAGADGGEKARFWRRPGELLIVTVVQDQFGNEEYRIQLHFLAHLTKLVRTEEEERLSRQREKEKAVRKVF